jgi:uncharacterized tellurite resistance protein B-like protein
MATLDDGTLVAFADGELDVYEDQFVRKIADLIYVPNTQCMLARQRVRASNDEASAGG